jgi:hypothetical protein
MFKGDAMIVRKQLYFSCLAALIGMASPLALAQQKHSHAHEHGKGNLEITLDKNRVISRFTSPLEALVGFERLPKSQAETDAIASLNQRLQNPAALFSVNAEAECKPAILENKIVRDAANKHADLHYQLEFTCAKPAALKQMTILLFKDTKHLKEVRVEIVGPSGQKSSTASAKSSTVMLN